MPSGEPSSAAGGGWGRGLALWGLPLLLVLGVVEQARQVDPLVVSIRECMTEEVACRGTAVAWQYGRLNRTPPRARFEAGGHWFELQGSLPTGVEVGDRISIAGTYLGEHRISVDRWVLHPLRGVKEWVGVGVAMAWALSLILRLRRRRAEDEGAAWPIS